MMAEEAIGTSGALLRIIAAIVLVLGTFNPSGSSYFHWATERPFDAPKALVGALLLTGWGMAWLSLVVLAVLLGIGLSWSHVRRRLTGQVDVDELPG